MKFQICMFNQHGGWSYTGLVIEKGVFVAPKNETEHCFSTNKRGFYFTDSNFICESERNNAQELGFQERSALLAAIKQEILKNCNSFRIFGVTETNINAFYRDVISSKVKTTFGFVEIMRIK